MIQTITRLIDANANGQVWIATHSVPLIAALFSQYPDDISLYFMQDGSPIYAGREPEQILLSLMGGEENIGALRQFIDLPELLAVNRFGAECLVPPAVVNAAGGKDPQVAVVHTAIGAADRGPVKILDYGAGHGRLLEGLTAILGDCVATQVDYVAWDVATKPSPQCVATIRAVYGATGDRWFNDRNTLFRVHDAGSFSVAIMCNVLHEIDPLDWLRVFESTSVLSRALHPDGRLVIVEDYLMPKGEYAHPYGFTLLDTEAIKVLFQSGAGVESVGVLEADGRYAGRIRAHVIPSQLLPNVTAVSRRAAIELAANNAADQISKLRTVGRGGFREGQAHAFWVQQFANCTLALKSL
jgi:hypothetical protein